MRFRILSFPRSVREEFLKARGIAVGPKGGRYYEGSERTDAKGRKVRQYVGKDAPKEGESLARYSEDVRRRGERDKRLPPVAHTLTRVYKGQEVRVTESEPGKFIVHVDGQQKGVGRSLTGALSHALGRPVSGYAFMRLGSAWDADAGQRDWQGVNDAAAALKARLEAESPGSRVLVEHRKGAGIRAHVEHPGGDKYVVDAGDDGKDEGVWKVAGPRKWEKVEGVPGKSAEKNTIDERREFGSRFVAFAHSQGRTAADQHDKQTNNADFTNWIHDQKREWAQANGKHPSMMSVADNAAFDSWLDKRFAKVDAGEGNASVKPGGSEAEPAVKRLIDPSLVSRFNNWTHYPLDPVVVNKEYAERDAARRKETADKLARWGHKGAIPEDVADALAAVTRAEVHSFAESVRSREAAPPWTVTGRSNYRGRPDKANKISENAATALESAEARLAKVLHQYSPNRPISSDSASAIDDLKKKIAAAETLQDKMRRANVIYRSKATDDEKVAKLMADVGLTERLARKGLEKDFAGRIGFPDYALTNNSAEIRRLKARVEQLEKSRAQETTETRHGDVRIVDSVEDNRLQIHFPDKPSAAIISELKSRGFKWSPTSGAWQRFRSNQATYEAERIVQKANEEKAKV